MKKVLYLLLSFASAIISLAFIVILFDVIFNSSNYSSVISDIIKCLIFGGIFIYLTNLFIKKYIKLQGNTIRQEELLKLKEEQENNKTILENQILIEKQEKIEIENQLNKELKEKDELIKQLLEEKESKKEESVIIPVEKKINKGVETRRRNAFIKEGLQMFPDDYVVFDLETTGLSPTDNKIIEIGAIKYKNSEKIDEFNILVNPQVELSKKIIKLTGITDDMLKDCETIDKVLPKFIEFIEDYPLVAHNSSFDRRFIGFNLKESGIDEISNRDIDTLYLARRFIKEIPNHKLETIKEYLKLENNSHRSLVDCETANAVLQYCKKEYYKQEI